MTYGLLIEEAKRHLNRLLTAPVTLPSTADALVMCDARARMYRVLAGGIALHLSLPHSAGVLRFLEYRGDGIKQREASLLGHLRADLLRSAHTADDTWQAPQPVATAAGRLARAADVAGAAFDLLAGPDTTSAMLVRQIAASTQPVSHDRLDSFPPSRALHRLRAVLVHGSVLTARAEYLARIQPWLEQLLADQPPSEANLVRAWVHWTLLRRARNRLPHRVFTAAAAHWMRACIIAAIRFLSWISTTNQTLKTLTQHDVDLWLTTTHAEHAYNAKEFLRWARSRALTGEVSIPRRPQADNPTTLTDEQRWQHLDRCLNDAALSDDVRAAGALSLLYGLTIARISRLHQAEVHSTGGHTYLSLGSHRLRLAPAVALLVNRCAQRVDGWLFPGGHPGTHSAAGLHRKLRRHGLPHASHSRATALISLAAGLPAPVLAELLGLSMQTATAWARHAGSDWAAYLAARIGGETTPSIDGA